MRAALERALAPGFSTCEYCHRPWNRVEGHTTYYTPGKGCFPLCEQCWTHLGTPEARLPFYRRLFESWLGDTGDFPPSKREAFVREVLDDWPKIERAVLAET